LIWIVDFIGQAALDCCCFCCYHVVPVVVAVVVVVLWASPWLCVCMLF